MTVTKDDLVKLITRNGNLPSDTARALVDTMLAVIKEKLQAGETVKVQGFGSFKTVERSSRKGRDFATGELIDLPPGKTVVFRPSDQLKKLVKESEPAIPPKST